MRTADPLAPGSIHEIACSQETSTPTVARALREVASENFLTLANVLAFPHHYLAENRANCRGEEICCSSA
jgi:hypothetical protein